LSDAFIAEDPEPSLELVVKVVNINYGSGEAALDRCTPLNGYSFLIAEIRKRLQEGLSRDEAIVKAINLCIEKGILEAFLKENYQEVAKMLNYEYDAEAERRVLAQESIEIGVERGREEGVRSVAKLLLNSGDSVDKVMAVTGLTYEEIESLRSK
jgi:predicted transposase/invertase (TIGR01784 family)